MAIGARPLKTRSIARPIWWTAACWQDLLGDIYPVCLFMAVNRQGSPFLWPVKLPGPDGKTNTWNESSLAAALAEESWIRVAANISAGMYDTFAPLASYPNRSGPICPFRRSTAVLSKSLHQRRESCRTAITAGRSVIDSLRHYREIVLVDFEFRAPPGEQPSPICMVAREYRTSRTHRVWADELVTMTRPPFLIGPDSLLVAYFASAELGCFLALGWPMPARVLDLFCEFRNVTNGRGSVAGNSLLGAMAYFGLGATDVAEKSDMRDLAIRGGPYSDTERAALLDYCESDVLALAKLLPPMLPGLTAESPPQAVTWLPRRAWSTPGHRSM